MTILLVVLPRDVVEKAPRRAFRMTLSVNSGPYPICRLGSRSARPKQGPNSGNRSQIRSKLRQVVNSNYQERISQPGEDQNQNLGPSPAAPRFTISEFAALFGFEENDIRERLARGSVQQEYYSIRELAERWRVSRGTVYNRLRSTGAKVLDFAAPGRRSKKAVRASVVLQIEARKTKKLC